MKNYKLHTSEGVRDYLGNELLVKEEMEDRIKHLFISYGYELVKTPTFEFIDVYSNNDYNVLQQPSLYSLINRQGEVLALRNDMTSSIARIVAANASDCSIRKYAYIASTFRYPRAYQGKSHEFTQAGIEIVGVPSIKAEVECIKLASHALNTIGLEKFTIHIGSSEFIETLFSDFNLDDKKQETLFNLIESKDFVALKNTMIEYEIDSKYIDLVLMIMSHAGKLNFLDGIISKLDDLSSKDILIKLKDLYQKLVNAGLKNKVLFDFSIYSFAKYYNGVIFQVFTDGIGRSIVDGGRCDGVLDSFGAKNSMIGFGLHVDAILEYVMNNNLIEISYTKYLSFSDDDSLEYSLAENKKLRDKGFIVSNSMNDTLEETVEFAKVNGYDSVVYYHNNKTKEIKLGGE